VKLLLVDVAVVDLLELGFQRPGLELAQLARRAINAVMLRALSICSRSSSSRSSRFSADAFSSIKVRASRAVRSPSRRILPREICRLLLESSSRGTRASCQIPCLHIGR
jgi:hypothetical protein